MMTTKKPVKKLVKAKEGISTKNACPKGKCGTYPNCYDCPDNTRVSSSGAKKSIPTVPTKIQPKTTSSKSTTNSTEKPTADSTFYYADKEYISKLKGSTANTKPEMDKQFAIMEKAKQDRYRQSKKGKPGYDKNGFPITKQKKGGTVKSKKKG
jgi:hypothetical protein